MKTIELKLDIYTKIILTIIAISLLVIAIEGLFQPRGLSAGGPVSDVNISHVGGRSVFGSLPVKLDGR